MAMVLAKSSNIGAIQIGMQVGQQNMYDYVRRFGFGQKTGLTLPAESPGKLRRLANWGTTSLASISMGQEVSVTTVQLAQAGAVVANGGLLVQPRLILKRGDKAVPPVPPVRVIRPETAITMRQMMEGVVLHGTGTGARTLEGYTAGGKTGSAQIFDFATRHYTHNYNGSFLGFAPVTNPAIVVVVTVNGTHGDGGLRRAGGGAGVPGGGGGSAAGAGCAQGSAGTSAAPQTPTRGRERPGRRRRFRPGGISWKKGTEDAAPTTVAEAPAGKPAASAVPAAPPADGSGFQRQDHAGRAGGSGGEGNRGAAGRQRHGARAIAAGRSRLA